MSHINLNKTILSKQLLSNEQCQTLVNRIISLKHLWLKHPVYVKTFTIGVPICSYTFLDYNKYQQLYIYYNNLLDTYFQDIKDIICSFVKDIFPRYNVKYSTKHGNPGFHIMYSSDNYTEVVHRDKQYKNVFNTKDNTYNDKVTFSFTLSLSTSNGNSGLYEYDNNLSDEYMAKKIRPDGNILDKLKPRIIKYKPGFIYFHSGNIPHSIIRFENNTSPRITLQGHGILEENTNSMYLYF